MNDRYLFISDRLGFRNWTEEDLPNFEKLNSDQEVMKNFPNTLSPKESLDFLSRLQVHFKEYGYTYFATEILATGELIGFIGLANQTYPSSFTPATDIGWRLVKDSWGNGYATEGAKRCLEFAFANLKLNRIISTCTIQNLGSEKVMQKIGMERKGEFNHPKLQEHPDYERCILYEIQQ